MAAVYTYTDQDSAATMVTELTDIGTEIKLRLINQSLEDSSALNAEGLQHYRPYYVSARQLQRNRDDQFLTKADGAEFSNLTIMIQSLLEEQLALDTKLGLIVPDGYGAQEAIDAHCGCGSKTSTASTDTTNYVPFMSILTA